jgi:serine/threonine protein kinase
MHRVRVQVKRGILNNLQSENARKILWRRRICWLYQVASALEYLHCLVTPPIIHRDIKTMNILLDESLNASIGDFGIARVCPEIITHSRASTRIFGTPGYIDPEYAQTGQLKVSCDIYSFGVVILELLNSRPAFDPSNNPPVLRDAFDEACEDREVNSFLDTRAGWPPAGNALSPTQKIVDMAVSCLKSRSSRRPKTEELAASLHSICTSDFCFAHQLNLSSSSTGEKGPAEEMECVICLSLPASHALIPCGHKCLCEDHATMTMALDPPLCPVN